MCFLLSFFSKFIFWWILSKEFCFIQQQTLFQFGKLEFMAWDAIASSWSRKFESFAFFQTFYTCYIIFFFVVVSISPYYLNIIPSATLPWSKKSKSKGQKNRLFSKSDFCYLHFHEFFSIKKIKTFETKSKFIHI